MAQNQVQFQKGISLPEFLARYGSEEQCEAALIQARWPKGFSCPRCGDGSHGTFRDGHRKVFQCKHCRKQTSLIAGTLFQGTNLPLTTWFLAIYLISQSKASISSLSLKRQLGVSYPTAWSIHHKLMQAMLDRENQYFIGGIIQMDDAYLGGELTGGKVGRGSENKVPFVAAVSVDERDHPLRVKLSQVQGFTIDAIQAWALRYLAPGTQVYTDGLPCFSGVTVADCLHIPINMNGRKPKEVPTFKWINTVLGNLKTSLSGTFHSFRFGKYANRYLGMFSYRFNRRFDLAVLPERLLIAAVSTKPCSIKEIRDADDCC